MDDFFKLVTEVGFPIAGAVVCGTFVFIILKFILSEITSSVKGLGGMIKSLENRVQTMNNDIVKSRMLNTTLQVIGLDYKNGNIERYKYNFIDSHYGAHYITALEIFKDNKVLGSGPKTFRIVCADNKYSKLKSFNIINRCSTHPHNFYMQILSETGIVGLSIFIISFLVFIIFTIKKIDLSNPLHNCTFITLILFLWPLQSTGSIFNNWYGLYLFYYMSILFILIFSKKDQVPDHLPE